MHRDRTETGTSSLDLLVVAFGAALGVVAGYVVGGTVGRVTAHRVKRALKRRRRRRGRLRPGDWTEHEAETLEARAVDALCGNPVLTCRPVRVRVLSPGVVELSGRVDSPAELQRAGQIVRLLPGVTHVINHLLVEGVDAPVAVPGPSSPRAARG